ncbi:MAG TPA: hypothetical protein H9768_09770 [Candidatus Mailhella merdavium]|nr:hypothetical protein [Candidatus Mailhella merdavium]
MNHAGKGGSLLPPCRGTLHGECKGECKKMDKILWHYDENRNVIIDDSPDREPYPFSLVLDFFPYSSSWWYKAIVIDKIVSIILNDTIYTDIKDEFEKILSGEVHQSKAITHMVNYCSMMRRDVQFVAKITDKDHKSGCIPDNDGCHSLGLESDNEQLEPCITELETELAACREQSPNTKTSAATKARQEKNLAEWKNAFKAMIPVILQCQEEGPKPRTTPELATMCAKNGVTLDKTKMAFLRECLRECLGTEYVNTTGGPTIQG